MFSIHLSWSTVLRTVTEKERVSPRKVIGCRPLTDNRLLGQRTTGDGARGVGGGDTERISGRLASQLITRRRV